MDFTNISKYQPIEPYINNSSECAYCARCFYEVNPLQAFCPNSKCGQKIDWTWFYDRMEKGRKDAEEKEANGN